MVNRFEYPLEHIAKLVHGKLQGDPTMLIKGLSRIDRSEPNTITFLNNERYLVFLPQLQNTAVLVSPQLAQHVQHLPHIIVEDPYKAFIQLLQHYQKTLEQQKKGIEQPCFIDKSVQIGEEVYIGAFCYIGANAQIGNHVKIYPQVFIGENVIIGDHTIIYPGVKILQGCKIGHHCIIHAGSVIGSDGFGYLQQEGKNEKIPQLGIVEIGNYVEIGANVTIDRALLGATIIEDHVKIDNLVQIAHNVVIGEGTVIASQSGIAGSTTLGKHCLIGGQVGIIDHVQLADGTKVGAQSGVSKSVTKKNQVLRGSPALPIKQQMRLEALFRKLPELYKAVEELKKRLKK